MGVAYSLFGGAKIVNFIAFLFQVASNMLFYILKLLFMPSFTLLFELKIVKTKISGGYSTRKLGIMQILGYILRLLTPCAWLLIR